MEDFMFKRLLTTSVVAAIAGAAMLTMSSGSASAFTLTAPSLEQPVAGAQIDHVWWRYRYWGPHYYWHPHYWGGHCWRGYYGRLHCW
jgi:hypothetical protein